MKLKLLTAFVFLVAAVTVGAQPAKAVNPINDAYNNRIIDDNIFLNGGSMNGVAIQIFLNSKVANCGNSLCLRNYWEGGKSAAAIIHETALINNINPQVLLSTLQKEQSLVTNPAPSQNALNFAMGYGCPEGPGCNPAYNGFTNQVTLGAKLLRAGAARNCDDFGSLPGWSINPKWHIGNTPLVDGRPTYLSNCSTGSFYNYTPHRPDSAYRGATNGTFYYGNYNFIKNFTAWFGSTWSDPYRAQYVGQSNISTLPTGSAGMVSVTYRNTGTSTWTQNTVRLGTSNPLNRGSGFSGGAGWISNNRVQMQEASVAPNQDAHFVFALTANGNIPPGAYAEYFRPVADGITWMDDVGLHFPVTVIGGTHSAQLVGRISPAVLNDNNQGLVAIRYRNVGSSTWQRDGATPFRLGTNDPQDHTSSLQAGIGWASNNRVHLQEASVPPFGIGTFLFNITTPSAGRFTEEFTPVIDGVGWLNAPVSFEVQSGGTYQAQWAGQSSYPQIQPGQTATASIDYQNTGTATWFNSGPNAVRLGTDRPQDRNSPLNSGWPSGNRTGTLTQATVAPGETGRFSFTIVGPPAGRYWEYFRPVAEGHRWFGPANSVYIDVNTTPRYGVGFVNQSAPAPLSGATEQPAWIEFRNTGNVTWQRSGANPIRLGTSNPLDRFSTFVGSDGWLTPNRIELDQATVVPGDVGRFTFNAKNTGNRPAGTYQEYFRPVVDGVSWLEDWGVWLPFVVQ